MDGGSVTHWGQAVFRVVPPSWRFTPIYLAFAQPEGRYTFTAVIQQVL